MVGSNPIGTCYEDAWRFLIREEEGELVHGSVQTIGKRINHAWVELPTGFVWEPESGEFMKKSHFYERAEPQVQARYTAEEAAIMAARTKKLGPWSTQERALLTRRSNVATANPIKEEQFATEVAKYLVERRKPKITVKELEAIARELEYENIEGLIKYIQSARGKEYFKRTLRLKLWKAGYGPRR